MTRRTIPFNAIRDASLAQARRLLAEWYPNGKTQGQSFEVGNINGDKGDSLRVSLNSGKWKDFADGDKGGNDLIGLRARGWHSGDRIAAARELAGMLGITVNGQDRGTVVGKKQGKASDTKKMAEPTEKWESTVPPPGTEPYLYMFKDADHVYVYRDADGLPLSNVKRIEAKDGERKQFYPISYGTLTRKNGTTETGWHYRRPNVPVLLYGLDRLANMPDATVLLCEGEKSADAAQAMFPNHVAMSWQGGAGAVDKADFTPLLNRSVIIWPDADEAGRRATKVLKRSLPDARVLYVWDLPGGDDAADVHPDDPEAWLADRLRPDHGPDSGEPADSNEPSNGSVEADSAERPDWLPRGFFIDKARTGIWFQPHQSDPDERPKPVFVCNLFNAIANTSDEHERSHGILLEWTVANGRTQKWPVPRRLLHDAGNTIAAELEDAGLKVGVGRNAHERLKFLISNISLPKHIRSVSRSGWHRIDDGDAYVLPSGEVYGNAGIEVMFQTANVKSSDTTLASGTLSEWRHNVARLAVGNSRVAFSIATAFAASLLDIVNEQSGGFHAVGGSQIGKTHSMARTCASVCGKGSTGAYIRVWWVTQNGLEIICAETCDLVLVLDELGMANARDLITMIYMLFNESGKGRMAKTADTSRPRLNWRTIVLSTGEKTVEHRLQELGTKPPAGINVRLASFPADAGKGLGIYENLHEFSDGAALSRHFQTATQTYYGTAIRAFMERLADDLAKSPQDIKGLIDRLQLKFRNDVLPEDSTGRVIEVDGQVVSVAMRFGLVAAAGELATGYGVTGWENGEATRATASCFRAWLGQRGGTGPAEEATMRTQVRSLLEQYGEGRFGLIRPPDPRSSIEARSNREVNIHYGYRRVQDDGTLSEYLIFPQQWREVFAKGYNPDDVAKLLLRTGDLERGDSNHLAKYQRVPGMLRMRYYTILPSIHTDWPAVHDELPKSAG